MPWTIGFGLQQVVTLFLVIFGVRPIFLHDFSRGGIRVTALIFSFSSNAPRNIYYNSWKQSLNVAIRVTFANYGRGAKSLPFYKHFFASSQRNYLFEIGGSANWDHNWDYAVTMMGLGTLQYPTHTRGNISLKQRGTPSHWAGSILKLPLSSEDWIGLKFATIILLHNT